MITNTTAQSTSAWAEDTALPGGNRSAVPGVEVKPGSDHPPARRLPSPLHFNTNAKNPSSQQPQTLIPSLANAERSGFQFTQNQDR
jgi:hypothetical protein